MPVAISTVAQVNHLHPQTLEEQYKEEFSNFPSWEKKTNSDTLVYPENFGKRMSIDETTLSKGELYTVITNKDKGGRKGALAALIKGTKNEVVTQALAQVPIAKRMAVREITADLANSMDWICRSNFPNATMTADRFHVQHIFSEAVQEVRIELRREAMNEENDLTLTARQEKQKYIPKTYANGDTKKQLLARGRYVLYKPANTWTENQRERVDILFHEYPVLKQSYDLSMYLRGIFERRIDRDKAKVDFQKWYERVHQSDIPPLLSAACTIEREEGKILNYFYHRETNASAESFNAKLKGFRALLRGVRDIKFFLFRVETLFA